MRLLVPCSVRGFSALGCVSCVFCFLLIFFAESLRREMSKPKEKKKEKISVATEIDRIEERRSLCLDSLDKVEYKRRWGQLSEEDRKRLDEEVTIITERIQKYDRELKALRSENRKNMMLSVALLALSALFYYAFVA